MPPRTEGYALSYSWLAGWLLGIDYHAIALRCLERRTPPNTKSLKVETGTAVSATSIKDGRNANSYSCMR